MGGMAVIARDVMLAVIGLTCPSGRWVLVCDVPSLEPLFDHIAHHRHCHWNGVPGVVTLPPTDALLVVHGHLTGFGDVIVSAT